MEFKRDSRDGVYKFMEVNARTNLSGSLAVNCGINFPWIIYRHIMYNEIPFFSEQKMGIYWIDIAKDLMHLIMSRNIEHFTMRQYVKPYFKKKIFAILSWKDPMPFIVLMRYLVSKAFSKIREGLKRRWKSLSPKYCK
jgi:predicted ATP-grasp superfamily ATP-dependent carboligase